MVNFLRLLLPLLSSDFHAQLPLGSGYEPTPPKSVAIIGAGSAGLAMLKTLVDLPARSQEGWEVVLFEERESVGGVWLPDHNEVSPPDIPKTPLYPLLHTNTPVPSMSYPGFPFPPGTPLYPSHEHIQAYHARYARQHGLFNYITFNHKVDNASWIGSPEQGQWDVTLTDKAGRTQHKKFSHLIVASGNHHLPRIPIFKGQEAWLANTPPKRLERRIIHSVYYREPEAFANQSVLVVGNGASGRDASSQVVRLAKEVFVSVRHESDTAPGVQVKPEISHFTTSGVVFVDSTSVDPDVVILGTGYELRKPFLTNGGVLRTDPSARDNSSVNDVLVSNTRYIFPLHQHIVSLDHSYPLGVLTFIGLPTAIANCPSDIAQSLFVAHVISNPTILPPRAELLQQLVAYQEHVRSLGLDPYVTGHQMLNGTSSDYQDDLVDFLREKGTIPSGKKFVEQWRRDIFTYGYLKRGWTRIEQLGIGEEWTRGVETEAQWADLMRRVNDWQRRWENENGIPFVEDLDKLLG